MTGYQHLRENNKSSLNYGWEETVLDDGIDEKENVFSDEDTVASYQVSGYTSPFMSRMSNQRLTVDFLKQQIPIVRAGEEAEARLAKATKRMSDGTRGKLLEQVRFGEEAKEKIFAAALPLIKTVAAKEWRRRQQWGSQVSLEDLTQETIIGFLKGISGFKTENIGKSATNYLGQWMLVETRRAAEVLDHDLQVGHDAGERFRRVRALRTRLATELGREPTDKEISEASRNPDYIKRPGLVGKAPKEGETHPSLVPGKGLTITQIEEERSLRTRVGRMARFDYLQDNESDNSQAGVVDPSRETVAFGDPTESVYSDPAEQVLNEQATQTIASLIQSALDILKLPDLQREIVARRYGLRGFEESSAREIARTVGVQRDKVSKILSAFQQEMVRPGGAFHEAIKDISVEDLEALGLGWTITTLGSWSAVKTKKPRAVQVRNLNVLTSSVQVASSNAQKIGEEKSRTSGFVAWFVCDYHDRVFSGMYMTKKEVPKNRACPACGRPSSRVKIVENE